jgi:hypothetical protein
MAHKEATMRFNIRCGAALLTVTAAAISIAPQAAAAPECTTISVNTTQCQTNGSSQIVTSPQRTSGPYWGWPWAGGFSISLGGWGLGW